MELFFELHICKKGSWLIDVLISLILISLEVLPLDEALDPLLDHLGLRVEHSDLPYDGVHQLNMGLDLPGFHDPDADGINNHGSLFLDLIINLRHVPLGLAVDLGQRLLRNQILLDVVRVEVRVQLQYFVGIIQFWDLGPAFGYYFRFGVAQTQDRLNESLVRNLSLLLALSHGQLVVLIEQVQHTGLETVNLQLVLFLEVSGLQYNISMVEDPHDLPVLELINVKLTKLGCN